MQKLIGFTTIYYRSSSNVSIGDPWFNFFYFLCLDTKKQKSRADKKLGIIKSIPPAKNI
jgi:hypothetical protein